MPEKTFDEYHNIKGKKEDDETDQNPQMKVRELITSLISWYTWNWSSYQTVLEFNQSQ